MKRLWIIIVVLLVGFSFAMAQNIHEANQATIGWDAPQFLIDGNPIPTEDAIAYNVFIRPNGDTAIPNPVGTVPELQYTITVPDGLYEAGVSALRYIAGTGAPYESDILWSLDASSPFLLRNGRPTEAVPDIWIIP